MFAPIPTIKWYIHIVLFFLPFRYSTDIEQEDDVVRAYTIQYKVFRNKMYITNILSSITTKDN